MWTHLVAVLALAVACGLWVVISRAARGDHQEKACTGMGCGGDALGDCHNEPGRRCRKASGAEGAGEVGVADTP